MRFRNRQDAAMQLIPLLERYCRDNCVVLAVPRGGVPIGAEIAKAYGFQLDLLMAKKIGFPGHPEYAVGAVTLDDYSVNMAARVPQAYIDAEVPRIRESLKKQYRVLAGTRKPVDVTGKTVVIVDDGIATGQTVMAAVGALRKKNPDKIIVAVPVAPIETAQAFANLVDGFICLATPEPFVGVGTHYEDFAQVDDQEVRELLDNTN
jgi:predicted phosphoribosyltransferase